MNLKLNQIIALTNGRKTESKKKITEAYHLLQKPTLMEGIVRRYRPKNDLDGDRLPDEQKLIQVQADKVITDIFTDWQDMCNIVLTQDTANCSAKADIVVDGQVVMKAVPVTHLLFLEKQLIDLNTFVEKIPTLDPGEKWEFDTNTNAFSTKPFETTRTKKVRCKFVKAEATDKHPAQVDVFDEDQLVGFWATTKFSAAIPAQKKTDMLIRVKKLQDAVKLAREEANSIEVQMQKQAKNLFDFVSQA